MKTSFINTLQLKRNARVQMIHNVDTLDGLTNGSRGLVKDIVRNKKGHVDKIMVKFDEDYQGKQRRESQPGLTSRFPGCTSVERVMFQYSLAKNPKKVSSTAKVVQFPLSLCFAATAHKFQGQTIHKPNKLAADFRTVFEAAQAYVMLSRVQTISQLFVIDSLPEQKFYASQKALSELERLEKVSVNKNPPLWEQEHQWSFKIVTLNIHSLSDKIEDLRHDKIMLMSNMICLTETWLRSDIAKESFNLPGCRIINSIQFPRTVCGNFIPTHILWEFHSHLMAWE